MIIYAWCTKQNKNEKNNNERLSNVLPPNLCMRMCCPPIYSGRLACGHASRGHTGGRSRRIPQPAGPALVFIAGRIQSLLLLVHRDVGYCVRTNFNRSPLVRLGPMQVALMVVNKFIHD